MTSYGCCSVMVVRPYAEGVVRRRGLQPGGPTSAGQQLLVHLLAPRARRDAQLVAQQPRELGVHEDRLPDVALRGERLHEDLVAGLAKRREADEPVPRADRRAQLRAAGPERV